MMMMMDTTTILDQKLELKDQRGGVALSQNGDPRKKSRISDWKSLHFEWTERGWNLETQNFFSHKFERYLFAQSVLDRVGFKVFMTRL